MAEDGILKTSEAGVEDPSPLELLVLQNMRHGRKSLRLLDIKVGEKTLGDLELYSI